MVAMNMKPARSTTTNKTTNLRGVSEGSFPNEEVVKLVASMQLGLSDCGLWKNRCLFLASTLLWLLAVLPRLRDGKDMGEAVKAVCHKAVDTESCHTENYEKSVISESL